MKPFHFKKFTVQQSENVFRVGTDAVLLGVLSSVENKKNILEVGTGTGVISLMLAQRNPEAKILSIDISENAVQLAGNNFRNSPFSERLEAAKKDFNQFSAEGKFDMVISNPPYFEENSSTKEVTARQQRELSFQDLARKSAEILDQNGILSVILPFESGEDFEKICFENQLYLNRKTLVFGMANSKPKRLILEFGFEKIPVTLKNFTIEKSPRKYSDEYLLLTKDFHVFGKNR